MRYIPTFVRCLSIRCGITALLYAGLSRGTCWAQTDSPTAKFEVASVRRAGPFPSDGRFVIGTTLEGGGLRSTFTTLCDLLQYAYLLYSRQQVAGPSWIYEDRYTINAKPEQPASPAVLRRMLQNLLVEVFHLRTRMELRETPVYALSVRTQGHPLKPAPAGCEETIRQIIQGGVEGRCTSMRKLTAYLSTPGLGMDRPVVDNTGLSGLFDFTLLYAMDGLRIALIPPAAGQDSDRPVIFTAVRDLGLRLEAKRAPVATLVVESAERNPPELEY